MWTGIAVVEFWRLYFYPVSILSFVLIRLQGMRLTVKKEKEKKENAGS